MWFLLLLVADCPDISRYLIWKSDVAALHAEAPTFSKGLKTGRDGARVVLEVEVDGQGLPRRARIVEGAGNSTHLSALRAIVGWRFDRPSQQTAPRIVRIVFVSRSMPAGTRAEELAPIYRGKYEIEVRALEDEAAEQPDAADGASRRRRE